MTNDNGRTIRLIAIAIVIGVLALVGVCSVGGYFVYSAWGKDTRTCKEQVIEFQDSIYVVATLQGSAAEQGAEGNYEIALVNAKKAEEMMKDILPPVCSIPAVATYNHFKRAVTVYRQSLDAAIDGRFEDAISLQEEAITETGLATSSLERMLDEQR